MTCCAALVLRHFPDANSSIVQNAREGCPVREDLFEGIGGVIVTRQLDTSKKVSLLQRLTMCLARPSAKKWAPLFTCRKPGVEPCLN